MKTITVNVQDNFVEEFLNIVKQYKDKIQLKKDKNLEYDLNFYEHQKELEEIRKNMKENESELISHEKLWGNINSHLNSLNK